MEPREHGIKLDALAALVAEELDPHEHVAGVVLPDAEGIARLVEARRQIAAFVAQPFPLGDTYVDGTVDVQPEPFASADERWLELYVGVTLFEL